MAQRKRHDNKRRLAIMALLFIACAFGATTFLLELRQKQLQNLRHKYRATKLNHLPKTSGELGPLLERNRNLIQFDRWQTDLQIIRQALAQHNYAQALTWLQKDPHRYGLSHYITMAHFHKNETASFVMHTNGQHRRSSQDKYRIDFVPAKITAGIKGVDLTVPNNFRATINHELRHIAQYEKNVHFCYSGDNNHIFWQEQQRESNSDINKKGGLNSRMEVDAYLHQLLQGAISNRYRRLTLNRLQYTYGPVLAPQSRLKKDLNLLLALYGRLGTRKFMTALFARDNLHDDISGTQSIQNCN